MAKAYVDPSTMPVRAHGTPKGYANWLCRCAACTDAWRIHYGRYAHKRWLKENGTALVEAAKEAVAADPTHTWEGWAEEFLEALRSRNFAVSHYSRPLNKHPRGKRHSADIRAIARESS